MPSLPEIEQALRERLDGLGPLGRNALLTVLLLPDSKRGAAIGEIWSHPEGPRLRRVADRLRGGPDAAGGARKDAARDQTLARLSHNQSSPSRGSCLRMDEPLRLVSGRTLPPSRGRRAEVATLGTAAVFRREAPRDHRRCSSSPDALGVVQHPEPRWNAGDAVTSDVATFGAG